MLEVQIQPSRLRRGVVVAIVVLAVAGIAAQISTFVLDHGQLVGLVTLFDPNDEANLPTLVSTALLAACALLMLAIASVERRVDAEAGRRWRVLAAIFALATVDEAVALHEKIGLALGRPLDTGSYAWLIPGALVAAALWIYFAGFLRRLPRELGGPLVAGLTVFLASALGIEAVEATLTKGLAWGLVAMVQEIGEMAGLSIVVLGLLSWLLADDVELRVSARREAARVLSAR